MKKLLVILVFAVSSITTYSQERETYQVHAMMIYNFIKYIEFTMPDASSDFITGVLSDDDTYKTLLSWYDGKIYKSSHVIRVKRLKTANDVDATSNLVFVTPNSTVEHPAVVKKLVGTNTMLLSAGQKLSGKGSVINFIINDGRMNFEVSIKEAEAHNLKISKQLLDISKQVD